MNAKMNSMTPRLRARAYAARLAIGLLVLAGCDGERACNGDDVRLSISLAGDDAVTQSFQSDPPRPEATVPQPQRTAGAIAPPCDNLACARRECKSACAAAEECGLSLGEVGLLRLDADATLAACVGFCRAMHGSLDREESAEVCPQTAGDLFRCITASSCDRLSAANPVCEPEFNDFDDACQFDTPPQEPTVAREVRVDVLGVLIAPVRQDRTQWVGSGNVSSELWDEYVGLLGQSSRPRVLSGSSTTIKRLIELAKSAPGPPAPFGSIEWDSGSGATDHQVLELVPDTFLPRWSPGSYDFTKGSGVRWRVVVDHKNASRDERIGSVTITEDQILEATALHGIAWIVVGDASNQQVSAVKIKAAIQSDDFASFMEGPDGEPFLCGSGIDFLEIPRMLKRRKSAKGAAP